MNSDYYKPTKKTQEIDWQKIHSKVNELKNYLSQESIKTPGQINEILEQRAAELAKEESADAGRKNFIEVVEFLLANEKYGIETSFVEEVHQLKELTFIPCTSPIILGVINIRGQIISIVDIKKFFELPEKGLTDLNRVIIIQNEEMQFGLLADSILGVSQIAVDELQSELPTLKGIGKDFFKGLSKQNTIILDAENILSNKYLLINEEVME